MPLRFCTLGRGRFSGVGRLLEMSSEGALVSGTHGLQRGTRVELTIKWPVRQRGKIPVRLIVVGKIVRLEMSAFAVAFSRHRFVALNPVKKNVLAAQAASAVHQTANSAQ
jgi:hypothetical protein